MIKTEKFILVKNKEQKLCEDLIFEGKRFNVIIDGATSKNQRIFNGKRDGRVAAEIIYNALEELESKHSNLDCPIAICEFIRLQFIPFYEENKIDYINEPTSKIVASCVIYDNLLKKLIFVGDCLAIVNHNNESIYIENNKIMDEVTSNTRSLYILSLLKTKKSTLEELLVNDLGREYILPLLKDQLAFQNQNIKFGYECFDGTAIPENMIKIVDVKENSTITLSSDGYPKLFETLEESEKYLQHILKEDPLLYKIYPSTKGFMTGMNSFDDRSYLSFTI
jgi:hypothetical protein